MQKFKHKVKNFITVYTVLQSIEIKLRQLFFCVIPNTQYNNITIAGDCTVQTHAFAQKIKADTCPTTKEDFLI